jgi:ribosomal 50S subunit-recycling heat shock protein
MRLDLFLKASRLVLRRTVARQFCDAGRISVNGEKAKPSKEVKPGDVIEIRRGDRRTAARVLVLPRSKQVSREEAADLVEITSVEELPDTLLP